MEQTMIIRDFVPFLSMMIPTIVVSVAAAVTLVWL
jgi:hypothetical protein